MNIVHQIVAVAAIALTVAVAVAALASLLSARRSHGGRDHRFAVDRLILGLVAILATATLSGLAVLAGPVGPHDGLHLLYAPLALATLPVGWLLGGRVRRRRDAWLVVACCILLALEYRLAVTG